MTRCRAVLDSECRTKAIERVSERAPPFMKSERCVARALWDVAPPRVRTRASWSRGYPSILRTELLNYEKELEMNILFVI